VTLNEMMDEKKKKRNERDIKAILLFSSIIHMKEI
jgi:hypothetical protein